MRASLLIIISLAITTSAVAQLKPSHARKLIARAGGIQLPSSGVRVKQVTGVDATTAEAAADIETAFRLEQTADGHWSVRDVRVAPDRWESVAMISAASGGTVTNTSCTVFDQVTLQISVSNERRARCLLAELLGVQLPSDDVRIKSVASLGLPFATASSATVVASIRLNFRFVMEPRTGWRVTEVKSSNKPWVNLAYVQSALDAAKRKTAMIELQAVAAALESFKSTRGFYVTTQEHRVLIDHLAPRYLARVIRVDPWNRPYGYEGAADHFTLRSNGPDGKPNTPDDIVMSHP